MRGVAVSLQILEAKMESKQGPQQAWEILWQSFNNSTCTLVHWSCEGGRIPWQDFWRQGKKESGDRWYEEQSHRSSRMLTGGLWGPGQILGKELSLWLWTVRVALIWLAFSQVRLRYKNNGCQLLFGTLLIQVLVNSFTFQPSQSSYETGTVMVPISQVRS